MPERVLYVVPDLYGLPGGIARHSRQVAHGLVGDGIRVGVVALHDQQRNPCKKTGPTLDYYACGGSRARFIATALLGLLQRPRLVLVGHVHLLPAVLIPARLLGIPVAVFVHGVEAWDTLPGIRGWAVRHADRVIAVSAYSARRVSEANRVRPEHIRVLLSSLGPGLSTPGTARPRPTRPHLLSVGRLSRDESYKGHRQVIAAVQSLTTEYPDLIYDVVGDGDNLPSLQALAQEAGVQDHVRFHGSVTDEQRDRLYAAATIFVLPSSGEGFGFVFLEAMAHGLPIVAGNRDATPEVVANHETGFLVDPDDTLALTQALSTLLSDETLRLRFGQAGKRRVEQHFSFTEFQRRLRTMLADVSPSLGETSQPAGR